MADRIVLNTISYHGHGAIENIVPELTARGYKKAFLTSDADLLKFGVTAKVTDLLDKASFPYVVYSDIKPNPTIENVQNGVASFNESGADCIIAIGGGSSMDTAKAIGIIATNPEFADVRSLEGVAPTKNHAVFTIAVPTTAGTAAGLLACLFGGLIIDRLGIRALLALCVAISLAGTALIFIYAKEKEA